MRAVLWPFCSQQDKAANGFLLSTCGGCKPLAFLAERMQRELGWCATAVLPQIHQTLDQHPFACYIDRVYVPLDNPTQRVHWNTNELRRIFSGADIAITNHEYLPIPLRTLFPQLRVVQMLNVLPDTALFQEAWRCSSLVATQGLYARHRVAALTSTKVVHWPHAFDADTEHEPLPKTVDVLFVMRCSASNYTKHEEFLAAVEQLSGLRVCFTDVTGYLRMRRPDLLYSTPETYNRTLRSSRTAVALNDNWYGGLSIREATWCGCVPVVLDAPCYRQTFGDAWPYYCSLSNVAEVVMRALDASPELLAQAREAVAKESCQEGWRLAKEDLCRL